MMYVTQAVCFKNKNFFVVFDVYSKTTTSCAVNIVDIFADKQHAYDSGR